ncbi:Hsp33 family molecular chaperone [Rhizobium sp. KVB221]|uniref:Hsp33 family molecular chaperone n=1 Tax=Rhizobium setariae TaxID=2801340 RepID=A0A937CNR2_9HYPH|nr:Hsp33 family molecular chaperone [Rhizobium setariae]MBL0371498.1 Hsp33 family molecular chaperone [Rhizobium setariae]
MTPDTLHAGEPGFAGDDHVVPFQVEGLDIRGRAVTLGPLTDAILSRHQYPGPVARLLSETIALTVLLGTSLKFEGKLTVQTQSDGPVNFLVADFAAPDGVRAYARYDDEALEQAVKAGKAEPHELLGKGILAFTIDQGPNTHRYQGIVQLDGETLEEAAAAYFRQSEQIPTRVRLASAELFDRDENGKLRHTYRAGGLVVQFLPEAPDRMRHRDLHGGDGDDGSHSFEEDDTWAEAQMLASTAEAEELTDPNLGVERLLFRLFHERGVRVYDAQPVHDRCSCSEDRIRGVISGFSADEIVSTIEDGEIRVTCEFCSTQYRFAPSEFIVPTEPN